MCVLKTTEQRTVAVVSRIFSQCFYAPVPALEYCMMYIPEGVGDVAGASLVALEAIEALRTHSLLAVDAPEARVTDAGAGDVVALGAVAAGAGVRALEAVGADGTLLLAPAMARDMAPSYTLSTTLLSHIALIMN